MERRKTGLKRGENCQDKNAKGGILHHKESMKGFCEPKIFWGVSSLSRRSETFRLWKSHNFFFFFFSQFISFSPIAVFSCFWLGSFPPLLLLLLRLHGHDIRIRSEWQIIFFFFFCNIYEAFYFPRRFTVLSPWRNLEEGSVERHRISHPPDRSLQNKN